MNTKTIEPLGHSHASQIQIWYCAGCEAVHLGLGETRVSFDRQRFSEFAEMVAEIHYDSFEGVGAFDILSIAKEIDVEASGRRRENQRHR